MPRNNKSLLNTSFSMEYRCPCGYVYTSNDKKGHSFIIKLHRRVCETAKKCIVEEKLYFQSTDINCGTMKQYQVI